MIVHLVSRMTGGSTPNSIALTLEITDFDWPQPISVPPEIDHRNRKRNLNSVDKAHNKVHDEARDKVSDVGSSGRVLRFFVASFVGFPLPSNRVSIPSGIGSAHKCPALRIDHDPLATSHCC